MAEVEESLPKRDASPKRGENYRKNVLAYTEEDLEICTKKLEQLAGLVLENREMLKKMKRTCLELGSINRIPEYRSDPIVFYWLTMNWKTCPEIDCLLIDREMLAILQHLSPKFCMQKMEVFQRQQETLRDLLAKIYDLYLKFFFLNGEVGFYPLSANVGFPFPREGDRQAYQAKVSMIHPNCDKVNSKGEAIYSLVTLVKTSLEFVSQLTAHRVLKWQVPRSTIETLRGSPLPRGTWKMADNFLLAPNGQKWVFVNYWYPEGGTMLDICDKYFKLPLSLDPENRMDGIPVDCKTVHMFHPFTIPNAD
jgi:hypothetical protein